MTQPININNTNKINIDDSDQAIKDNNTVRNKCMPYLKSNLFMESKQNFFKCQEDKKCAPNKKYDGTCFTLSSLLKIAISYNNYLKNNKLGDNYIKKEIVIDDKLTNTDLKKSLLEQLTNRLKNVCNDQVCWIKLEFIRILDNYEISKNTFRPNINKTRFVWITNQNINELFSQYESIYPDFKFLGIAPYDFHKVSYPLINHYDIDYLLSNGFTKYGVIFNNDTHEGKGTHWTSYFCDITNCKVYFFDSAGKKPKPRFHKYIQNIAKTIEKKYNKKVECVYNNIRHQFNKSECGMYSIYFILCMLKGKNINTVINKRIGDIILNAKRDDYFTFE